MSLGYSSKKSNKTIGQYGNGSKTSTMRLGADAIVFTRSTREGYFELYSCCSTATYEKFHGCKSNFQPVQLNPEPVYTDTTRSNFVGKSEDEINEENIQLFMRCEEYIKKETEMEQTVRNLEKELEEAKRKCAQLALLVAAKRNEMQQV
ncbi:compromised recognition of TCV 1 [Raphanus sativus]|nr:compromised recognition of TCV 1 [Raphanus sativus]